MSKEISDESEIPSLVDHLLNNEASDVENSTASVSSAAEQIGNSGNDAANKESDVVLSDEETPDLQNRLKASSDTNTTPLGCEREDKEWYPMKQPVGLTR